MKRCKAPDGWASEWKYDGERIQIHKSKSLIRLFSRNCKDVTARFPDIVKAASECMSAASVLVEGEVVAWRDGRPLPFQVLCTRKRKDVDLDSIEVPVRVFLFDCLHRDGVDCLGDSLLVRRKHLTACFDRDLGRDDLFAFARHEALDGRDRQFR